MTTAAKAVADAISRGELTPQPCEVCGLEVGPRSAQDHRRNIEAHHEDYDKPLDVRWLCRTHHVARHVELGTRRTGPRPPRVERPVRERIALLSDVGLTVEEITRGAGVSRSTVYRHLAALRKKQKAIAERFVR